MSRRRGLRNVPRHQAPLMSPALAFPPHTDFFGILPPSTCTLVHRKQTEVPHRTPLRPPPEHSHVTDDHVNNPQAHSI